MLDSKIPLGALKDKWTSHKFDDKLVNPANRRKYKIIVVGTGLAGASAAASLGEMGYNVESFSFRILPVGHIPLLLKAGLMPLKIILMMVIVFVVYFMTLLKVAIFVPAKLMFTV